MDPVMKIAASSVEGPLLVKVGTYDDPKLMDVTVPDLAEASRVCRAFIDDECLGSSNWRGGEVVTEDGECVAVVSYNGRVWTPGLRNPEGDVVSSMGPEFDLGA